jgi:hypothetical protein
VLSTVTSPIGVGQKSSSSKYKLIPLSSFAEGRRLQTLDAPKGLLRGVGYFLKTKNSGMRDCSAATA